MKMIGLARLGRDAELRHTPSGEAVCNLALAFNYGKKGEDGNRPTQWVDASLWGQRAESLVQYLRKGGLVVVEVRDPHIETYQGQNGTGYKLVGTVSDIELAGGRNDGAAPAPAPAPSQGGQRSQAPAPARQAQAPAAAPRAASGFEDMDDDIPFRDPLSYNGMHAVM